MPGVRALDEPGTAPSPHALDEPGDRAVAARATRASRAAGNPRSRYNPGMEEIETTDYHTAGEPFRIVREGVPDIPGATVRERREFAARSEDVERVRRLLCHEPRGHADMYGCFLVPPDDDGADLGVLFWHKDGYSTACGHGTIALGAWAVESGRVAAPDDGDVDVTIDVPSGRVVRARAPASGRGRARRLPQRAGVRHRARGTAPATPRSTSPTAARSTRSRRRSASGCGSCRTTCPALIAAGREVKRGARGQRRSRATPTTSGCRASTERCCTRRSARCTSATWRSSPTARSTARPPARRRLRAPRCSPTAARSPTGSAWRNDSIVGTTFHARAIGEVAEGLLTEVEGTAFRTGEHRFVLDPRDPLGTGFILR